MNTIANPYAPPTAHVSDVESAGGTQPLNLWTYKGRIGRLRYTAWMAGSYIVMGALIAVAGLVAGVTGADRVLEAALGISWTVFILFWAFWTIQRSHDMDWTGWSWLWTLIPLVVLIWAFKGGTRGPNRFGAPPPPNTLGVHLLSWVLPLVFVVAMLASIPLLMEFGKRMQAAEQANKR